MRCGLFGKLSAKRDFIALATPRHFLEAWEPWVQASLSASRHQLGDQWQQTFLTMPVMPLPSVTIFSSPAPGD